MAFMVKDGSWREKRHGVKILDKPETVGYFSIDGNRTYLPDASNLMYYNPPKAAKVHFDLNQGIESVRRKPPGADNERIDHLLKWINLNSTVIRAPAESKKRIQPDFVCFRGLLTTLLVTPYSPRDGWIICASKWKGTIYLCAFKTLDDKRRNAMIPQNICSWGFKFEKYILSGVPDKEPDTQEPVDEAEEFCCMFQRRFGRHTILYGAEMDGVYSKSLLKDPLPLKDLKFIELKTSRTIENSRQDQSLRKFKLLKWWSQSFLVGIENVLCGFRDDSGMVDNLTSYSLEKMVDMSKSYWQPQSCINFLVAFLTHVSETVDNECDKTVYKFERIPYGDIVLSETSPRSEYAFMPSTYLEEMG